MSVIIRTIDSEDVEMLLHVLSPYGFKYVGRGVWLYGDVRLRTLRADKNEMERQVFGGWFSLFPEDLKPEPQNTVVSCRYRRYGYGYKWQLWWDCAALVFGGRPTTWPGSWEAKSSSIVSGYKEDPV